MTIRDLMDALAQFDPARDVFVLLSKENGTDEEFDIGEVKENDGRVQLQVKEDVIFFEEDF